MSQQGPSRPFRPIVPRTSPGGLVPAASSYNNDELRVKRASMACTECKRRRTKCSFDTPGGPCYECTVQGSECIIDESADKRRKVATRRAEEDAKVAREDLKRVEEKLRRTQEQFRHFQENVGLDTEDVRRLAESESYCRGLLDQLIQAIRIGGPDTIDTIVNVIKSTESKDQLHEVLNRFLSQNATHMFGIDAAHESLGGGMLPDGSMSYFYPGGPI